MVFKCLHFCIFVVTHFFVDHVARMGGHLKAHLVDGRELDAEVTRSSSL